MKNLNRVFMTVMGLFLIGFTSPASAGHDVNVNGKGLAVKGYDVVAYHDLAVGEKAVKGSKSLSSEYEGAKYRFATAENKGKFDANPAAYAPEYGGYCAYAYANGKKVGVDPNAWAIVDGKLYLNYSKNVQKDWNKNRASFISKADAHWAKNHK